MQMQTEQLPPDAQVLSQGVIINGEHYYFVGSSAGQLREQVAVLYRCSSPEQAWQLLLSWGDFGSIGSAAKMYKRIGLMFSGALAACTVVSVHTAMLLTKGCSRLTILSQQPGVMVTLCLHKYVQHSPARPRLSHRKRHTNFQACY